MNSLDKYIESLKEEFLIRNITDELEILRYIYMDLGNRLSFNPKYRPFGTFKYRINHYKYHCESLSCLNEAFEEGFIICKSIAYMISYIASKFDIDIAVEEASNDQRRDKHVYNVVTLKDGRIFIIDLQEDIRNIRYGYYTKSFGKKSYIDDEYVISRNETENIDIKLGFISNDKKYNDEYKYLLHFYADGISDMFERLDFILENIDVLDTNNIGYTDRQWNHKEILEEHFDKKEFNYDIYAPGKIRFIDCHINIDGKIKYICLIQALDHNKCVHYIYNDQEHKYEKIDMDKLAELYDNGLIVHKNTIHGLGEYLRCRKK